MCPLCITTAVLTSGSVICTGGLMAIAIRKFGGNNAVNSNPGPTRSKEDHHG